MQPPFAAPGGESPHPLPPSPPSRPSAGHQERYAGVGVGGDFLAAVTTRGRTLTAKMSGGTAVEGDGDGSTRDEGDGSVHGYRDALGTDEGSVRRHRRGAANGGGLNSAVVAAAGFAASRTRDASGVVPKRAGDAGQRSSWWKEDQQPPAPPPPAQRDVFRPSGTAAGESREKRRGGALDTRSSQQEAGSSASAVRFSRCRGGGPESSASPNDASAVGPSAIADEALASLGGGTVDRSVSGGAPRIAFGLDAANGKLGTGGVGVDRGLRAPYYSSSMAVDGSGTRSARGGGGGGGGDEGMTPDGMTRKITESMSPPPTPLKAAPTAVEQQPHPAYASRSPAAPHHSEGVGGAATFSGRDGGSGKPSSSSGYHHEAKGLAGAGAAAGLAPHGSVGARAVGSTLTPFVGRSWGAGGGVWGASGGSFHHGDLTAEGGGGGGGGRGEPFRSASWAEKLVTKREEQVRPCIVSNGTILASVRVQYRPPFASVWASFLSGVGGKEVFFSARDAGSYIYLLC